MRIIVSGIAVVVLFALSACSAPASIADSEAQVTKFHQMLDGEHYGEIWNGSSNDMKQSIKEDDLIKLLASVHKKLGNVQSSKQVGWRSNSTTNGAFTELAMATTFEHGSGQESFVFRTVSGRPTLAGWHINSNDMIAN